MTPPAALICPTEHTETFCKAAQKIGVRPSPIQLLSVWVKTFLMVIGSGLVCGLFLEEVETFQEKR